DHLDPLPLTASAVRSAGDDKHRVGMPGVSPCAISRKLSCAAAILAALMLAACSESAAPEPAADAAPMSARTTALLEAARTEGSVTVYSSLPVHIMTDVANAFRARYG